MMIHLHECWDVIQMCGWCIVAIRQQWWFIQTGNICKEKGKDDLLKLYLYKGSWDEGLLFRPHIAQPKNDKTETIIYF